MIREINRDIASLSIPSQPACRDDMNVGQDLIDTLAAHADACVGMAANMIGIHKWIIIVNDGERTMVMYNPNIIKKSGAYETSEGCLSLTGERTTTRYETIRVRYYDDNYKRRTEIFTGWTAQIIQHEIDHCEGKII